MGNEPFLFWENISECSTQTINTLTELAVKSYYSITDLDTKRTWWSKSARDFFGLQENYTEFGCEKTNMVLHPYDKTFFRKAFENRLNGINLDKPIEYRIMTSEGRYDRFSAMCRIIYDDNDQRRFLITRYNNHGIADTVDSVTGLHTENSLLMKIKELEAKEETITILKIGIDRFSVMNVLYGAEYCDEILYVVSQILINKKTLKGYAYRMQGAKFAVLYKDVTTDELRQIYEGIASALGDNVVIQGKRIPLKISGGAVVLDRKINRTDEISSRLTYAMEHSRYHMHGDLVVFNEDICGNKSDKLELVSIIHQDAVDNKEGFFLCYQPIVDSGTGKIKGMEALIRWKNFSYGVVPPNVFIEWLEQDACIFELGNWIIKTALSDCKKIVKYIPDFFVNINVCPEQIQRKEFRTKLLALIDESGLEPKHICIELTERCRILDVEFLKKEVMYYRSKGIKIALDDFGTGTSSLGIVIDLPLDEVKIDMSFIRDIQNKPNNQAMVKSIVEFTKRMNLEVCIEGVENEEVVKHLKGYGATWLQGYYYSPPCEIGEIEKMLAV